jgi:hypothetical protein
MQLSDLVSETLANGFDPVQFGKARVVAYLNDGYAYVCSAVNYTGDEAAQDFSTAAGVSLYPQPTDMADLRSLRDVDRNRQLVAVSLRALDRSPSSTGTPTIYALNGQNFYLYPTPDGVYHLECRYWQVPPLLVNDSDVPSLIPAQWHWLLWSWAVAQCFRAEDDVQRAGSWDARFQKGLSDFSASVKFTSDQPTQAASMWNTRPAAGYRYW